MHALESPHPGGSEFVQDPEFCARHIRHRMDTSWQVAKRNVIRNRELEAENSKLQRKIEELTTQVDELKLELNLALDQQTGEDL